MGDVIEFGPREEGYDEVAPIQDTSVAECHDCDWAVIGGDRALSEAMRHAHETGHRATALGVDLTDRRKS